MHGAWHARCALPPRQQQPLRLRCAPARVLARPPPPRAAPLRAPPPSCQKRNASGAASGSAAAPPEPLALRPYQAENVAFVLAAVSRAGRQGTVSFAAASPVVAATPVAGAPGRASFSTPLRLLYVLPTGGGKTVVLAAVMAALARTGLRTLFLVHRTELLHQTDAQLRRLGVEAALIAPGAAHAPQALVQVASVQMLQQRLHKVMPQTHAPASSACCCG
jgi:hypothetical protein